MAMCVHDVWEQSFGRSGTMSRQQGVHLKGAVLKLGQMLLGAQPIL